MQAFASVLRDARGPLAQPAARDRSTSYILELSLATKALISGV
jgi:hypothetical protein